MKRLLCVTLIILSLCTVFSGCNTKSEKVNIAVTTRPVWEFATRITSGTDLTVKLLISEPVSCLHDYSLNVDQVRTAENADVVILSGAGLESSMISIFDAKQIIDCSAGISFLGCDDAHDHKDHHDDHSHDIDPHIWLSPNNAKQMAVTICQSLTQRYPQHKAEFQANLNNLLDDLNALENYGHQQLSGLPSRNMITFHDGFAYFAQDFDCTILRAVEEESGSEASAAVLKELIMLVERYRLPAVFTEENGSTSAARIIASECNIPIYTLDMALSERSYFEAMYHNIDTIKEALK